MQWCIEYVADADKELIVEIDPIPFVIGRSDDCDLKLTDKRISRRHSEIRISSDLLWIRDLGSMNGTIVNQNKIEQAQMLEPNDIISIGRYKFRVKSYSSASTTTERETVYQTLSEELQDLSLSSFEPKLKLLIQNRDVIPHFQPIIRFSDMVVVGYEILGRISDKGLPSSPAELLDMAECLGYAVELSSIFREAGVELGKKLPGSPLLFFNSTRFEIREMGTFLASMKRIRDIAPSSKVVLEINEKAATDTNELPALRRALEKMDIRLAFDDFGVGQTRLVELSNTPPDYLKFDMSLIRKIHLAPKRLHQMISTFIKVSHDLGILTLAEGVEYSEESDVCKELGFDLAQGYLFGKPQPINALQVNFEAVQNIQNGILHPPSGIDQQVVEQNDEFQMILSDLNKTIRL